MNIEELKELKLKLIAEKRKLETERKNIDKKIIILENQIKIKQYEIDQIEIKNEIEIYEPHMSVIQFLSNPLKPTTEEVIKLIQHYEDEHFVEGLLKYIKETIEDEKT